MEDKSDSTGSAVRRNDGAYGLNDHIGVKALAERIGKVVCKLLAVCLKDEHLVLIELAALFFDIAKQFGNSISEAARLCNTYNFAIVIEVEDGLYVQKTSLSLELMLSAILTVSSSFGKL